ncbi:unnamed protein product [Blepharisma stoltei]|uniref:Uncharacterized protein n=1 Tax=Blepharisma stoltei TaxID=1481888 RepID=A0AAU9J2X5_9CILI|nr:unnamed protein product [Blepharisma stoltei]
MEARSEYHYLFKVVLIGDSHVGKSSLLLRHSEKTFKDNYLSTIGVDFKLTDVYIDDSHVKLQIWDTAGQERFRTVINGYYRGSDGVIVVFDKTDRESFEHVDGWINEVDKYATQNPAKILVGNKSDMPPVVDTAEGLRKAEKYKMDYIETSAKEPFQVDQLFDILATKMIKNGGKERKGGDRIGNREKTRKWICC